MSVAILTDTNSGISVEEGKQNGIFVIPMPVIVDGKDYLEHESITHDELYVQMRAKKPIATSQPSPQVLLDLWNDILSSGYDQIVHIPMSSGLSNSCETAMQFAKDFPDKVFVADNLRLSITLRESVFDAKYLAEQGKSGAEIKEILEKNAKQSSIYFAVNSLEYLKKGGRISGAAAAIATVLNIKPILSIQNGKINTFAKIKGMKKSIDVMIKAISHDIEKRFSEYPAERLAVGIAGTLESQSDIDSGFEIVRNAFPQYGVYYSPLSCSIACHVGINAFGIGVCVKEQR